MAGRTLIVDMRDDDLIPAWQTVIELAETGISADWTLIGGLMIAAHARRAGVMMRRPTDDVDVLVDYMANRASLLQARTALLKLRFELGRDEKHAYRFMHPDGRKLDLMVADHLPSRMDPRLDRRPAFAAPSGEQAIRRRDAYQLRFASGAAAEVGVPDELGALVAKAAAWLVDRRDRGRHLDDLAVLLACVADASDLDYGSMSKNDRKRIRSATDELSDLAHASWVNLDDADRDRGMFTLRLIRQVLELPD
jgi:hypothetical protein